MGPGMLGGTYGPHDIRFATQQVVTDQGGVFVQDRVVRIDPEKKQVYTESGQTLDYDVLSFNAGSYISLDQADEAGDTIYPAKPIEKLMNASQKLAAMFRAGPVRVAVVGGGPSAAEVAGNVLQLFRRCGGTKPNIRIYAGKRFMARFTPGVRNRVRKTLEGKGIQINEGGYVSQVTRDKIVLDSPGDSPKEFAADFTFMASGVNPSPIFEASGLPVGPDKGLLVNSYLQSTAYPDIFGGGDCIYFEPQPLDKVGVYAVRQNPVLLHNLKARLEGGDLMAFDPGPDYLLIFNLGDGQGVLKKYGIVFGGRLAFWIKDYIDRKFIRRFQAIEK
jgi:NADH dehydrogenase FAD-containing subunit